MGFAFFLALSGSLCLLDVVPISSPSPRFALPAHLTVPHCSHPRLAHGSLHCPAKTGRVGCFHLPDYASFSPLFISQAPVLCPEMRGVVSVSDSPQQPISGSLPPLRVPSPWHEMNHPPTAPVSPVLQQQLLGCFPPVSQAGSTTAKSSSILESQATHKEQRLCATKTAAQGRKVQYVFILGLYSSAFPPVLPPH